MTIDKEGQIKLKEAALLLISTIKVDDDEEAERLITFADAMSRVDDLLNEYGEAIKSIASACDLVRVEVPPQEGMVLYVPKEHYSDGAELLGIDKQDE